MVRLNSFGIYAGYSTGLNSINTDYHAHNNYEMFLVLEKNADYYIEQSCYHMTRGCLLLIAPNEVHKMPNTDDMDFSRLTLGFEPSRIRDLGSEGTRLLDCFLKRKMGENNMICLDDRQLDEFLSLANKIINCSVNTADGNDVLAFSYLLQLLVFTNRVYFNKRPMMPESMPTRVQPILKYIDDHLTEDMTLDSIAKGLNMSRSNIGKIFREETDSTIHNYIVARRIVYAKELLASGYNVTETCFLAGFSDYASFIRCFKKVTGNTPGIYKKHWRG